MLSTNSAVEEWVANQLGCDSVRLSPVSGGKNNRAYIVQAGNENFFLKQYFADTPERFEKENNFLRFISRAGVEWVPKLFASDVKRRLTLMSYVDGGPVTKISNADIIQAADFINEINHLDNVELETLYLTEAQGALLSVDDFLHDIERRIGELNCHRKELAIYDKAHAFVQNSLYPLFLKVAERVLNACSQKESFRRVISPSDFGFHNAIRAEHLYFIDFEYAGWDSLEKLITDFYSQPRFHIDTKTMARFISRVNLVDDIDVFHRRCLELLPIAHLKWALIFLNEFKAPDSRRRRFATKIIDADKHLDSQLDKAQYRVKWLEQYIKETL